ncbi:monosaccharide-transporting ATPase [Maritalea myrionectae]|uniref:Monosaccharide-transporting ATPase n=2 Tax=Maritalea myrionectae TaxID=454601 RepID=A0A2R4M9F9_9HYPH|nr:monosaccharide-transporting ATPase [Maritalea myrionectae]
MTEPTKMLDVTDISLRFGGVKALTDISFHVDEGEIFSLIGPNGAGKTSMLNCISGRYKPQEGSILFDGKDLLSRSINDRAKIGIGRTFQNLALFSHMSVIDNILVGRHHMMKNNFLTGMLYWVGGAQKEEAAARAEIEDIIDFLEIQHVRNEPAGSLSYGLRKRVELARAIAIKPKLILLDEPMAGMNLEEKEDMARYIIELNEQYGITVVMIEHDMGVVVDISHRVAVLDFGQKIAEGLPEEVVEDEQVKTAYLGIDDFSMDDEKEVG